MRAYDVTQTLQDFTHLQWVEGAQSSATGGTLLKAKSGSGNNLMYYKLSSYDSYRGIFGHECVNELIASRFIGALDIAHVPYRLIHATVNIDGTLHETWMNASRTFRPAGSQKMPLDVFYDLNKIAGESPLKFCTRYGWSRRIQEMMLVDFLIINRDRHGANIEVIKYPSGELALAPLFDNGLSFVFSTFGDEQKIAAFDPLADVPCNNYLGYKSLERNLEFVPTNLVGDPFCALTKESLFHGLGKVLSATHQNKIWDILNARWSYYENL